MVIVSGREYRVPHSHDPNTPYGKYAKTKEAKIHGINDEDMPEVDALGALQDVDNLLNGGAAKPAVGSGYVAARATFDLMSETAKSLAECTRAGRAVGQGLERGGVDKIASSKLKAIAEPRSRRSIASRASCRAWRWRDGGERAV